MKSKGSSLYEVLKSASRPAGEAAPAPATPAPAPPTGDGQPTLQERLAAYKAQKLAEVQPGATAVATPPPVAAAPPPSREETPAPFSPIPAPAATLSPARAPDLPTAARDPGERVVRLTYNTLAFAGLVAVGLLFISYALGVHSGRARAAEPSPAPAAAAAPAPAPNPAPKPQPPPAPPKVYTFRLAEWPVALASQRTNAELEAESFRKALERANYRNVEKTAVRRANGEARLVLYMDRFSDPAAPAVRSKLAAVQAFKVGTRTPFAQAGVEEAPREAR